MILKKVNYKKEADTLLKLIDTCYGPNGSNFIVEKLSGRLISKSGSVLSYEMLFGENDVSNVFYKIAQNCGISIEKNVGSGIKTTLILFCSFYKELLKIKSSEKYDLIITELEDFVENHLEECVKDFTFKASSKNIENILLRLCDKEEEFFSILLEAIYKSGKNTLLCVEDGNKIDFELEYKEGFQISRGWSSFYFDKEMRGERVFKNPLIACFKQPLVKVEQIASVLEESSQWKEFGVIIFAPYIESQALETMIINDKNNHILCCAINTGNEEDLLEDLAVLSGTTIFDNNLYSYENYDAKWFGSFKEVVIKNNRTVITQYNNIETEERVSSLAKRLKKLSEETNHDYDREKYKRRIARLTNGICAIKSGGVTDTEIKERKSKLEKILLEVKSILKYGFVPGAGNSYYEITKYFRGSEEASSIFLSVMMTPILYLLKDPHKVQKYLEQKNISDNLWLGYDLEQEELCIHDIVDSYQSFVSSIKTGFATAKLLANTEVLYVGNKKR